MKGHGERLDWRTNLCQMVSIGLLCNVSLSERMLVVYFEAESKIVIPNLSLLGSK